MTDDVSIIVGGQQLAGWERIAITLKCEGFPNQFDLSFSTRDPVTKLSTVGKAGDPCQVKIGGDVVVTGYIDRDELIIGPRECTLSLTGRGKTQDLVDCDAEFPSNAIFNSTAMQVASQVASVYPGLAVRLAAGASAGPIIEQLLVNYGEKAAEVIQRVARNAGLLAYEASDGALLLSGVGSTTAASGVVYGQNVQALHVSNAMDERFSTIVCVTNSLVLLSDVDQVGDDDGNFFGKQTDPNVPRHRQIFVPLELAQDPNAFTELKAKWEIARRAGRSTAVNVTIDSWRDSAGILWAPNTLIPVDVPGLRYPDKMLCLSEVTFRLDNEGGTTADLYLLPPIAFTPEPITLVTSNTLGIDQVSPDQ